MEKTHIQQRSFTPESAARHNRITLSGSAGAYFSKVHMSAVTQNSIGRAVVDRDTPYGAPLLFRRYTANESSFINKRFDLVAGACELDPEILTGAGRFEAAYSGVGTSGRFHEETVHGIVGPVETES